jgi:hypothetical protein
VAGRLPRDRERLDRGETVTFGRFALTSTTLTVDGSTYDWSQVERVHARGRRVVELLVSTAPIPMASVPCEETPHLRLLMALADERIAAHGAVHPPE